MQAVGEALLVNRQVEAGHRADFGIGQRRRHFAQIVRPHAHVAVADHQVFVRRLAYQARQLGDLVVGSVAARAEQHADGALREFPPQPVDQRRRRVLAIVDAKEQLVIRIVLPAEAGEVLIGVRIEAPDWLQDADRGREPGSFLAMRAPEEPPAAKKDNPVVDEGDRRYSQKHQGENIWRHLTS